ncbi:MAG: hypothetical protein ABIK49_05310 [candidate division WOR-3 bacterium]
MAGEEEKKPEGISWSVHRARESPIKTVFALLFLIIFTVFTFFSLGLALALVAVVVLGAATHTYFLPISYRLDAKGVTVDKRIFQYTYEWGRFRRFFHTRGGVVLSPFAQRNFLDNFRGVHLLLPRDAGEVIEFLKSRLPGPDDVS